MADDFSQYIRSKRLEKNINLPVPLPNDPTTQKAPIVTTVSSAAPALALYKRNKRKR